MLYEMNFDGRGLTPIVAAPEPPECGMIDTQPGAYCYGVEPARDCTTDSDCVEKYGE